MYSSRSLNLVLKGGAKSAGINRNVSSHMLRYSYAIHLLENGVDLRYIRELLRHKSSKTTEIYTYVSNHKLESLPSPFDLLKIKITNMMKTFCYPSNLRGYWMIYFTYK
ncbi:MAG: hypothetical protein CL840_02755 [Crocinitomicaceae bacterium]|nr:hypothetical protein [Crocinitomicaceae bacterium]